MDRSRFKDFNKQISFTIPVLIFILTIGGFAKGTFQPVYNPTLEVMKANDRIQIDGDLSDASRRWKPRHLLLMTKISFM
jgi:hypothetical protein